jgi:hypothetical protein
MSAGKIIAYIAAAIFIGLGGLYILSAFGSVPQPETIIVGVIMVGRRAGRSQSEDRSIR